MQYGAATFPYAPALQTALIVRFRACSFLVSIPLVQQQLRAGKGWLGGDCSGFDAWVFNAVFNGLLLILFINFHAQSYRKRTSKKAS